jgi:hypothetical protein
MRLLPMEATARTVAGIQVAVGTRTAADTQGAAGVRTGAHFMEEEAPVVGRSAAAVARTAYSAEAAPMAARFTGAARTE